MTKNIYKEFNFSKKYKKELTNFLKDHTTIETGGNKIFDGTFNHLLQIPDELSELIFFLKKYEKENKVSLKNFLEIGFSHGLTNTILNKFFNFDKNVAIDILGAHLNGTTLLANLRFKNLILFCSNANSEKTINDVKKLGPYNIVFIDADHKYQNVKNDFNNYCNFISDKGLIIMHDIFLPNSGSKKFWNQIKTKKRQNFKFKEIICKRYPFKYGIGILYRK